MNRHVEQVAIRIHRPVFGVGARGWTLGQRLLKSLQPFLDFFNVVDLETKMIDAAWRVVTAITQEGQREKAVTHVNGPAFLRQDDLHVKNLLVEFRKTFRAFGLNREMSNLAHRALLLTAYSRICVTIP